MQHVPQVHYNFTWVTWNWRRSLNIDWSQYCSWCNLYWAMLVHQLSSFDLVFILSTPSIFRKASNEQSMCSWETCTPKSYTCPGRMCGLCEQNTCSLPLLHAHKWAWHHLLWIENTYNVKFLLLPWAFLSLMYLILDLFRLKFIQDDPTKYGYTLHTLGTLL